MLKNADKENNLHVGSHQSYRVMVTLHHLHQSPQTTRPKEILDITRVVIRCVRIF